jgi:uncharacterized protein YcnI
VVKKLLFVFVGAIVVNLLLTTVAMAGWTPQDIYDDFVTNGKLTRDYTDAELNAYLNDASLAQYSDDDVKKRLDDVVKDRLSRDVYPFTGFQIAILVVVVVALIGGGVTLRKLSRPRKPADKN